MKATRLPNLVKIFSLIGVLVTISIDGFSDNKKDSLLHVVSSSTSDLTILNAYVELDSIYFNENLDSALFYNKSRVELATELGDTLQLVSAYSDIGTKLYRTNQLEEAFSYLTKAKEILESSNNQESLAKIYNQLGVVSKNMGLIDQAVGFYNNALEVKSAQNDSDLLAKLYNNLGLSYQIKGENTKALEYFYKSIEIREKKSLSSLDLIPAYNNIGLSYMNMGQQESAREFLLRGLALADSLNVIEKKGIICTNLGQVYANLDNTNEAIRYFNQAINFKKQLGNDFSLSVTYIQLADFWFKIGEYKKAEKLYLESIDIINKYKSLHHLNEATFGLGSVKYHNQDYKAAKKWFNKTVEIENKSKTFNFTLQAYEYLSKIYYLDGDYEFAYHYLKMAQVIDDSLSQYTASNQMAEMRLKYETEFNKRTISNLRKITEIQESEKRKNYLLFIASFVALVASVFIGVLLYRQYHIIKVNRDEFGELNTALEEKNTQLNEAINEAKEALQVKSEFIATVSHEIRTPMNAIIGMTFLMRDTPLTEEQEKYLNAISTSSQNLMVLLNDILDFSKMEANKMELDFQEVSLRELVSHIIPLFDDDAKRKNIDYSVNLPNDLPDLVYIDGNRLRQVLINLLSNSFKFTSNGSITLDLAVYEKVKSLGGQQVSIRFSVEDSGIGISKQKLSKIFNSFQQGDSSMSRKYGGVGLGLSISQRLVKMMGSQLQVESIEGEGATFYFTLKLNTVTKKVEESREVEKKLDESFGKEFPMKILIAEDNELNSELFKLTMRKIGYECELVSNGQEVLNKLENNDYDIIFMDIQMPVMDGVEATKNIIDKYGDDRPYIIASTADAMGNSQEHYIHLGMDDYISKPFQMSQITTVITKFYNKIHSA